MLRILFFLALGASVTLTIISESGSDRFEPWSLGFAIATIVLGTLWLILGTVRSILRGTPLSRKDIEGARASGRLRVARIVSRNQTGTFVNEQPMIRFTLLVDRPRTEGPPFITTVRQIVSLLDLHKIVPGEFITVAHPDPETNTVYILDEPLPQQLQSLDEAAVSRASKLPDPQTSKRGARSLVTTLLLLPIAFLVGAVGAPFLVTPQAPDYIRLLVEGKADQMRYLDHPVLFDASHLQESLARLADEAGHEEVHTVNVHDVRLTADVPLTPGAKEVDRITLQDHAVQSREPRSTRGGLSDEPGFVLSDVDWAGVIAEVPRARELAVARGLADAELSHIVVMRGLGYQNPVEAHLHFTGVRGNERVSLDSAGKLLPDEELELLSDEERESYLFSPEPWQAALTEMSEAADTDLVTKVTNHGDSASLETLPTTAGGATQAMRVSFTNGQVSDIVITSAPPKASSAGFRLGEVEWSTFFDQLPAAQAAIAEAGIPDASVNHLTVEKDAGGSGELTARVYLRNEAGQSGSVVLTTEGKIQRVYGPR